MLCQNCTQRRMEVARAGETLVLEPWNLGTQNQRRQEKVGRAGQSGTQRGTARPKKQLPLQQARRAKTSDRIHYQHWLPLEDPAGHRISQRHIAEMNQLHNSPQIKTMPSHLGGVGQNLSLHAHSSKQAPVGQCTKVLGVWHRSNRQEPRRKCPRPSGSALGLDMSHSAAAP